MTEFEEKLLQVFHRALRCNAPASELAVETLQAWDSLTHIKLVMELEMAFGITIGSDEIPTLYKDFATVADHVRGATGNG